MDTLRCYLAIILICTFAVAVFPQTPLGFSRQRTATLQPLETQLQETIRPERCRAEHRIFTEKPHLAGSQRNYELAQHVAQQWRAYGLQDVTLIEHPVYLPWPVRYEATIVAPVEEKLSLKEEPIPQDKDSYSTEVGISYCAYSADIDVTAEVVYVNSDAAFRNGLILWPNLGHVDGVNGDVVTLAPPFIITEAQLEDMVAFLERSLDQVATEAQRHREDGD